ncbi:MAG: FtsX-like permease family protein [Fulvivirga sp.]|nr:FtsX-like permease family protein [Fulvivirga sp.]
MTLTDEHINYIVKDIQYRGVVDDELGEELVDHICSLVEEKMAEGTRFIEAYEEVRKNFGDTQQLQEIQTQTIHSSNYNTKIMLRNYFKIAVRNLRQHKFYSLINITGLAVSMACCLLISLFVINELSYDTFFEDSERIYRSNRHGMYGDNEFHFATSPAPFGPALANEIPEIERVVRFRTTGSALVRTPDMTESNKEDHFVYADSGVFKLFSMPLLAGNADDALKDRNSVALSKSMAEKYFGSTDIAGKEIVIDGNINLNITAVYEDFPDNSHLNFNFIMSMERLDRSKNTQWLSNNFYTYFKVKEGVNPATLEDKINKMADVHVGPQMKSFTGHSLEEFRAQGNYMYFEIQPITDVYLHSNFTFDIGETGDITYVYLFMIIALFILVIACINYMNLSTARSASRAKEVGVRKVLGSYKSHLVRQFLTESVLISLVGFILSAFLAYLAIPFFNEISGKSLTLPLDRPIFYVALLGGALIVGVLAGIYPAFFLSSFKIVNVLKGKLALGSNSGLIRSALVVFQFFISIVLLVGTATVYQQLQYIQNKKIGFDKEQVIIIKDTYMLGDNLPAFKEELKSISQVSNVSSSGFIPVSGYYRSDQTFWEEGKEPTEDNLVNMQFWTVDEEYLQTMGIELLWGRNFNKDKASDSSAIILNETAFKAYNLVRDKENWILTFGFNPATGQVLSDEFERYRVIGVIKDFHFESMEQPIGNLALKLGKSTGYTSAKVNSTDYSATLDQMKSLWNKFAPELPFDYEFLDSAFGEMYRAEKRLARVFTIFAGLAIFIGCLGLFALATFMAEQRTKEIGIRKVMGASEKSIVFMLSKEFSKLIIIAFVLAIPFAWWGISQWLGKYAYKIDIGVEVYLLAGVIAFIIAWLTVGYQAFKAAISNPVDALRSE